MAGTVGARKDWRIKKAVCRWVRSDVVVGGGEEQRGNATEGALLLEAGSHFLILNHWSAERRNHLEGADRGNAEIRDGLDRPKVRGTENCEF